MWVVGYAGDPLGADMADVALLVLGVESFEALTSKRHVECLKSSRSLLRLVLCLGLIHEAGNDAAERIRRRQVVGVWLLKDLAERVGCPVAPGRPVMDVVGSGIFEEAGQVRAAAVDKVRSGVVGVDRNHFGYSLDRPVLPNHTSLSRPS